MSQRIQMIKAVCSNKRFIYYTNLILHSVILSTAVIPLSNGLILFLRVIIACGLGAHSNNLLSSLYYGFLIHSVITEK